MIIPKKDPSLLSDGEYFVDVFNKNPIFKVKVGDSYYFVRDWNEAFYLHDNFNLEDINFKYLAAYISEKCDSELSPYKRISRVPRGHHVEIKDNNYCILRKEFYKYKSNYSQLSFNETLDILQDNIEAKIRYQLDQSKTPNIACEHSSGIDSNAILGFIIKKIKYPKEKLYTVSNDGGAERSLILDFREKYGLDTKNCFGEINLGKIYEKRSFEFDHNNLLDIFGAPPLRGEGSAKCELLSSNNCKLLISGFGGDQGLSHHGRNVKTNLLLNGDIKGIFKWDEKVNNFIITKRICSRSIKLIFHKFIQNKYRNDMRKGMYKNLLLNNLTNFGKNKMLKYNFSDYVWELDQIVDQHQSIFNRISADWVCIRSEDEARMNNRYGIKKVFPFLDEDLIGILMQINPTYFNNYGNERYLIRELFKDYLPEYLYQNPSKYRPNNEEYNKKQRNFIMARMEFYINQMCNKDYYAKKIFKIDDILKEVDKLVTSKKSTDYEIFLCCQNLYKVHTINIWFRNLKNKL